MAEDPTLTVTRIAHASVLLDFAGSRILTDPWFRESWMYHRGEPLGIEVEDLPALEGVVVSHDHYDHNDMASFAAYADHSVPIALPAGAGERARRHGFGNLRELEPEQSTVMGGVRVTAIAGRHHQVPEHTYVLEAAGFRVYFGGDSLVVPAHRELRERFGPFDLALLPCNGLRIRIELNRQVAASAASAAELSGFLRPRYLVPIHYAFRGNALTERLVIKHSRTGASELQAAARHTAPGTQVRILAPGEPLLIEATTPARAVSTTCAR